MVTTVHEEHDRRADAERLSALLDGELDAHETSLCLRRLGHDAALSRQWAEYCLIRDALRGEALVQPGLCRRVHAALAQEPTILAPMRRRSERRRWLRGAGLVAAAAAVGGLTWMLWTAAPQSEAMSPQTESASVETMTAHHPLQPYLAAHQDFAQGVAVYPQVRLTRVSWPAAEGGR
ncbi:MAG: sigma-E factor negative regulatory protein [Thiobacillaceae bacterium]|nr:sigma-E factor negative regulatory protein [Thiobacillaceae bacterium]